MSWHRLVIGLIAFLSGTVCVGGCVRAQPSNDHPFTVTWPDTPAPLVPQENIWSVAFANGNVGWMVGGGGSILTTQNSGRDWKAQTLDPSHVLNAVRAADVLTAWVVGDGGTILATRDGGLTWTPQKSDAHGSVLDAYFVGKNLGWVVGEGGTILATHNGGAIWDRQQSGTDSTLYAVYFADDAQHGWAVGAHGTILVTSNGGATWTERSRNNKLLLDDISFVDERTGWVVGQRGTVLSTNDGGNNWEPQTSSTGKNLTAVYFVNRQTGWAVGDDGTIITTRDGGHTWQPWESGTTKNLLGVFFDSSRTGWVVGDAGTVLRSSVPLYAPWIEDARIDGTAQLHVSFLLHTGKDGQKVTARAEARVAHAQWNSLGSATEPSAADHRWHISRNPADIGIHSGDAVDYRVILDDGGPQLAPEPLGTFTYDPWFARVWRDDKSAIVWMCGALSLLSVVAAAIGIQFWLTPARLARMGPSIGFEDAAKSAGNLEYVVKLVVRGLEHFALPWLCRHPRVRRAWIETYRRGEAKFSDLGKSARESYFAETDLMDTWVARHIVKARDALYHLDLFEQRLIYIPINVRVDDPTKGRLIQRLSVDDLRPVFAKDRVIISIVASGGSGKSTLACAIARWASADNVDQRLTQHQMLPVFITEETTNLLTSIVSSLHRMFGDEDLPDDLVHGLLAKQRLLVIVDALSELGPETQAHLRQVFAESVPLNAIILTSRAEPRLEALDRTTLYPMLIDAVGIVPFLSEYLNQILDVDQLKEELSLLQLGERILALAQSSRRKIPVTPLLVTLFINSAVQRVLDDRSLNDMPDLVPEVFIDYLRRLNASAVGGDIAVANEVYSRAAQVLATVSVGRMLIPQDFPPDTAIEALAREHLGKEDTSLIERFVASGLLERRMPGGIHVLRFALDPVAEYLAAIDQLHRLKGAPTEDWEKHIAELQRITGSSVGSGDFLVALSACYRAYQRDFALPEIDFPWEHPISSHSAADAAGADGIAQRPARPHARRRRRRDQADIA